MFESRDRIGGQSQSQKMQIVMERSIICCVRLQTLLYISCWYDLLFVFIQVLAGWAKFHWIQGWTIQIFFWANYFICLIAEPCRIYLGYRGNLGERVPELFLFVFLCFSCVTFFVAEMAVYDYLPWMKPPLCTKVAGSECILPVEKAFWIARVILTVGELCFGVRALRRLIHEQSARFFVSLDASEYSPLMCANDVDAEASRSRAVGSLAHGWEGSVLDKSATPDKSGIAPRVFGRQLQTHVKSRPHVD